MSDQSPRDRLMSGTSWEAFCDTLKAAGQTILADGSPDEPIDRAEGFRYLSRLTRADNPDNYYQSASLSGKNEYRITGTRGTIHYLGFATQTGGVASSGQTGAASGADCSLRSVSPDRRASSPRPVVATTGNTGTSDSCADSASKSMDRPNTMSSCSGPTQDE